MRLLTLPVQVGNIFIGGRNPIRLQSMVSYKTMDTEGVVEQSIKIIKAGGDLVRITAQSIEEAKNLKIIKENLLSQGFNNPLIADVHFNPAVAEVAARIVEKVRINPGNYIDKKTNKTTFTNAEYNSEIEKIALRLNPLVKICKEYGTAIRVGVNSGSLSERIIARYDDGVDGMVESALEFIKILENLSFKNFVLSIKSSDVKTMIFAYRKLVLRMIENGNIYPLHIGVTEAGEGEDGRIKSCAGIGSLLLDGIGDTVRVSLSEPPENEIPIASHLVGKFGSNNIFNENIKFIESDIDFFKRPIKSVLNIGGGNRPVVISDSKESKNADFVSRKNKIVVNSKIKEGEIDFEIISSENLNKKLNSALAVLEVNDDNIIELKNLINDFYKINRRIPIILKYTTSTNNYNELLVNTSALFSSLLVDGIGNGLWISAKNIDQEKLTELCFMILQANNLYQSYAEFVSCPTCGRTTFDLFEVLQKVKLKTSHLKNLKIAVMGCIVNGPGEMGSVDYGYVGSSTGKVNLYKGKNVVRKNVNEKEAIQALIDIIKENGD